MQEDGASVEGFGPCCLSDKDFVLRGRFHSTFVGRSIFGLLLPLSVSTAQFSGKSVKFKSFSSIDCPLLLLFCLIILELRRKDLIVLQKLQ